MATHFDRVRALSICAASNTPVLVLGPPGEGKTSIIEQIGEHAGWHVETVIASISSPDDFKGLPVVKDGGVEFAPPAWAKAMIERGGGLVFFDEITTAPPSVQAALLRPVLSKAVGDVQLPPETRFIAAANPPEIAADGWDLSAPLANRFVHIEDWEVDVETLAEGFSHGFAPAELPTLDPEAVESTTEQVRGLVGAFLRARPDLKSRMPESSENAGKAWPSPRSWEMGATVLAFARAANESLAVQALLLSGSVGPEATREFLTWEDSLDLPDVEKAINDGGFTDTNPLPTRPDHVYVVGQALSRALVAQANKARLQKAINGPVAQIGKAGHRDVSVVVLRSIREQIKKYQPALDQEVLTEFWEFLGMMGKTPTAANK